MKTRKGYNQSIMSKQKKKNKRSFYGAKKDAPYQGKPSSYLQNLLTSPSSVPNMRRLFDRSKYSFFGDDHPYYAKSDPYQYQQALGRCLEWFVFDVPVTIMSSTLSPGTHWLNWQRPFLSPEDIKSYQRLLSPVFGMFEILQVDEGHGMQVCDMHNNREYYISEKLGTSQLTKGDSFVGRIFPWEDYYTMSGVISFFPKSGFKSRLNDFSAQYRSIERFNALTWEQYFKLDKTHPIENLKNLSAFRKKLTPLLSLLTSGTMTWNQLMTRIQRAEKPVSLVERLMNEIQFISDEERMLFSKYMIALWNHIPRPSLEGKSPSERAKESGELEQRLTQEMVDYVFSQIQPDDYPTAKEASKAANALKDKWLNTPQEKLGGKTPLMAIIAERESLGNSSQEFEIVFDIKKI